MRIPQHLLQQRSDIDRRTAQGDHAASRHLAPADLSVGVVASKSRDAVGHGAEAARARPDLEPHLDAVGARVAELLAIDRAQVGIKIGSPGGLGGVSDDGMEAWAVALLLEAPVEEQA